ncbi:phage tail family protein [Weizmannia sp. CD-2023]|uniref:distal tail protein Dit n=1 Tax=Heyndrickxia TaxID=2837504 RepID=UPI002E20C94F|nr:distal tail protein Dit [Weizmannia sp. CD-2023]MED4840393.1 phage tail family protein [Weizmannia sp. CD-2023]MED4899708.1 phage tail family protein [Weizmannia sp. CD-2023]
MFTFKGETSTSYEVREKTVKHTVLPPVSTKTLELPFHDGVLDFGRVYGSRTIEVTIGIKGISYGDLRSKVRRVAKWLDSETLQPLIFSDEPNIQYMARVSDDTSLDQLLYYGETTLKFFVPNPFGEDVHCF